MTESLFYNKNTNKWEIMGLNFVKDSSGGSGGSGTPANTYSKTEVNNLLSGKLDTSTYNTDKANFKTKVTVVSETEPTDKEVIWIKPGSGNSVPSFGSQKTDKPTMSMNSKTAFIIDPNNLKELKYFVKVAPSKIINNPKTVTFNTTLNFTDYIILGEKNTDSVTIIYIDKINNKFQIFYSINSVNFDNIRPNSLSQVYEMSTENPFYYAYNESYFSYWDKATNVLTCVYAASNVPYTTTHVISNLTVVYK